MVGFDGNTSFTTKAPIRRAQGGRSQEGRGGGGRGIRLRRRASGLEFGRHFPRPLAEVVTDGGV